MKTAKETLQDKIGKDVVFSFDGKITVVNELNAFKIVEAMEDYTKEVVKNLSSNLSVMGMLVCPYCGDSDFDKEGLKYHLQNYCDEYRQTNFT